MRNLTRGAPGLWLAALFLVVRLLASSMAMATPAPTDAAGFCHSGLDENAPAHEHSCLVCPACHIVSHVALPTPAPTALPTILGGDIGRAAAPPPSTGPPRQPRVAAHPTGPPSASI